MEDVSPPKPKGIGYPKHRYFMTNEEYRKLLENALNFHKMSKDKKAIKRVEDLLKSIK